MTSIGSAGPLREGPLGGNAGLAAHLRSAGLRRAIHALGPLDPAAWRRSVLDALLPRVLPGIVRRTKAADEAIAPLPGVPVNVRLAALHLSAAIRCQTVSSAEYPDLNAQEFGRLQAQLERTYVRVHAQLQHQQVGYRTMLYTWPGSDPDAKPIALLAHRDVVPIASGTEGDWEFPPFDGAIENGFVWGRGAWDNKGNLIAQLEAIELLLAEGFQPRQTVYLVHGDDEEVGGLRGAAMVAQLLRDRGVQLDYVLDEGMLITHGMMPGIERPVALVGIAEKGYASFRLEAEVDPGHSSMPPEQTAIGMLSAAVARLESARLPASINGVAAAMLKTLAPEMTGATGVMMRQLWLTHPVVRRVLEKTPSANALLRTTLAPTIFQAGDADNVLPGRATATVNVRLLPGDGIDGVAAHIRNTVANDAIRVTLLNGSSEASAISSTEAAGYLAIRRSVRELFPDAAVAPGLMIGATDARHFAGIADAVYRFSPVHAGPEDMDRFHGTNERLSEANLGEAIQFYHRLLRNSCSP